MTTTVEMTSNLQSQLCGIIRDYQNLLDSTCEEEFKRYISHQEKIREQWLATENECRLIKEKLDAAAKDISVLENKLRLAGQLVDEERIQKRKIIQERDNLGLQLNTVREILLKDCFAKLPEKAKKELIFLESSAGSDYVDAISIDRGERLSYINKSEPTTFMTVPSVPASRTNNDVDDDDGLALPITSTPAKYLTFVKDDFDIRSPSTNSKITAENDLVSMRSEMYTPKNVNPRPYCDSDCRRVENTYIISKSPIMMTPSRHLFDSRATSSPLAKTLDMMSPNRVTLSRSHNFIGKTFMMPKSCTRCYKKIAFGRVVMKCADCGVIIHPECVDELVSTCKLNVNHSKFRKMGCLSDYIQHTLPPFVPDVVADCVKEIERRGLKEPKLYRIPGTRSLINRLLEDMRGNKEMRLDFVNCDTHSICRAVINFFENLEEPLIPPSKWETFAEAVTNCEKGGCDLALAVSMLPRVNRDTLAFIVLHLQNIHQEANLSIEELVGIFINVIFGHNTREFECASIVFQELILLPATFWNRYVSQTTSSFTCTPSKIDRVSKESVHFSPVISFSGRKKRFFNVDPMM